MGGPEISGPLLCIQHHAYDFMYEHIPCAFCVGAYHAHTLLTNTFVAAHGTPPQGEEKWF
jgi:hypothetical protein